MIDDIQFLIGKESTQEDVFHTFNYLYETGKQVIITSDKPPKDFTNLEERLRSRFSVGLPVDVSAPDYETRVAILHKKEETENTKISDDIINYIAENINTNIRELEGALNRITAFKRLSNKEITLNMAEDVLRDIINNHKEVTITVPLIVEVIASHFGFEADELLSQKRNKDIAYSRQIAMYLCRQMTDLSLQQIGKELGNRDHTTVRHGIEKITEDLKNSQFLQDTIDVLQKKINRLLAELWGSIGDIVDNLPSYPHSYPQVIPNFSSVSRINPRFFRVIPNIPNPYYYYYIYYKSIYQQKGECHHAYYLSTRRVTKRCFNCFKSRFK